MDSDISRWIIEFLLRSCVPESLLHKTLRTLPLSGADTRLKKTLLLRSLHTLLLKASLSETALDILELLENLDTDFPVSESHCRAYCAVAVECTVKYLAAASSPDDPGGEYVGAVRRVWKGRVAALEARRSGLVTGELRRWRDDVEAAMKETRVCERLAGLNSRREAMSEVRVYLKEAWELMGPSFLESVAAAVTKGKGEGGSEFVSWSNGRDIDNGDHGNDGDGDGACMVDVSMLDENHGKEQLDERVDANEEVGRCDLPPQKNKAIQKRNPQLKHKQSVLRTCNRGVKIYSPDEVEEANSWSKHDPVPSAQVKKVRESLKTSSLELQSLVKDPLPDALHTSEVVRSKLATRDTNIELPIENQNENVDVPNPNVCKTVVLFQHNDANPGKKSSFHCSNVDQPKFLEQNRTARTFEWNDSIDNLPQPIQPRRRKRKWTSLEEETLRAGVKMFGEGNWATIRSFYSNIFESRSGVDLKDKWRNMIR